MIGKEFIATLKGQWHTLVWSHMVGYVLQRTGGRLQNLGWADNTFVVMLPSKFIQSQRRQ